MSSVPVNAENLANNAVARRKQNRNTRKIARLPNWNNSRNMNNVQREINQAKTIQAKSLALAKEISSERRTIELKEQIRLNAIEEVRMEQERQLYIERQKKELEERARLQEADQKRRRINVIGDYDKYIKYYKRGMGMSCTKDVCGQGGYGKVLLSTADDGTKAIVKIIVLKSNEVRRDAINEAEILQEITPMDISPEFYLFFIDTTKNYGILIMKYIEAVSLVDIIDDIIKKGSDLESINAKILPFINQLDEVVKKLHSKGIIHYDLKPDNALAEMLDDGTYKIYLIDFGSAQRVGQPYRPVPETRDYSLQRMLQRTDPTMHNQYIGKKFKNIKDTDGSEWLYFKQHYNELVGIDNKWKISPAANKFSLMRMPKVLSRIAKTVLHDRER
jgi:tRNA A-37 threonylcarbamoyl transferase component Bud32